MALSGELEFEVEIKSPGSVFVEIYGSNKEYLPKICSKIVPRIDLLEGEWGQVGCVIMVYYSIGKATNLWSSTLQLILFFSMHFYCDNDSFLLCLV